MFRATTALAIFASVAAFSGPAAGVDVEMQRFRIFGFFIVYFFNI